MEFDYTVYVGPTFWFLDIGSLLSFWCSMLVFPPISGVYRKHLGSKRLCRGRTSVHIVGLLQEIKQAR